MQWIKDPPPKDKDFLLIDRNGKMIVCKWYPHPHTGKYSVNSISDCEIYWDKVDWMPLPEYPKNYYGMKAIVKDGLCYFEDGTIIDPNQPIET